MRFINAPRWPWRRPKFLVDFFGYAHWRTTQFQEKRLEKKFSIETSIPESDYLSDVQSENKAFAVPYEAIQIDVFNEMLSCAAELLEPISSWHFVDMGSGKGRALIYAAEAGFRRCTGIEFSQSLHEIAKQNIQSYRTLGNRQCQFSLHCMDAVDFTLPDEDIVLFMYNPFSWEVMEPVLENIEFFCANTDKDLIIMYRNPTCSDEFEHHGLLIEKSQRSFQIFRPKR
jgi:SAM-dependent methyltransferase